MNRSPRLCVSTSPRQSSVANLNENGISCSHLALSHSISQSEQ